MRRTCLDGLATVEAIYRELNRSGDIETAIFLANEFVLSHLEELNDEEIGWLNDQVAEAVKAFLRHKQLRKNESEEFPNRLIA